jgi:hypothetical protein
VDANAGVERQIATTEYTERNAFKTTAEYAEHAEKKCMKEIRERRG